MARAFSESVDLISAYALGGDEVCLVRETNLRGLQHLATVSPRSQAVKGLALYRPMI